MISRRERRARKARRCFLCEGLIAPGERYVYSACYGEADAYDWSMHLHCKALAERFCMAMGAYEYGRDDVEAWASDEVCSECDRLEADCEGTPLTCPRVIRSLLPPPLLTHEDIRRHLETGEA